MPSDCLAPLVRPQAGASELTEKGESCPPKEPELSLLPPNNPNHEWIPGGTAYQDWLSYGHQAPGVVHKIVAAPVAVYQRLVFTWGPLLAVIFLVGLGGVIAVTESARRRGQGLRSAFSFQALRSVRLHWSPRGTSMLPWFTAVALLVVPIAVADFDYRYLIPVIPFACMAAGLAFAPRRAGTAAATPPHPSTAAVSSAGAETVESTIPDSVS